MRLVLAATALAVLALPAQAQTIANRVQAQQMIVAALNDAHFKVPIVEAAGWYKSAAADASGCKTNFVTVLPAHSVGAYQMPARERNDTIDWSHRQSVFINEARTSILTSDGQEFYLTGTRAARFVSAAAYLIAACAPPR